VKNIEHLTLLKKFIVEEIGRNYHTLDNDPFTFESFADYHIETYMQENGRWRLEVSYKGKKIAPASSFSNEEECKHRARMLIDKHRVGVMNTEK